MIYLILMKVISKSPDLRSRLSLVAGEGEISNFDLVKDLAKVVDYLNNEISGEFLLKY